MSSCAGLIQQGSSYEILFSCTTVTVWTYNSRATVTQAGYRVENRTDPAYSVIHESMSREILSFYSSSWHLWLNKHEIQHPVSKLSNLFRAPYWVTANSWPWISEPLPPTRGRNGHYSVHFPHIGKLIENSFAQLKNVVLTTHSGSTYWASLAWLTFSK